MAQNRVTAFLLLTLGPLLAAHSLGCGGSFDDAPPTLPFYLHRLPAKSLEEIYGETLPPPNGKGWGDYQKAMPALADKLATQSAADLLPEIDHLLELARFDPSSKAELFNLLHDLHDAFAVAAPKGELAAYVRWRFQHADWFGLSWKNEPSERRRVWDEPSVSGENAVEVEKQLAAASPALRPQWLYLRGALGFKSGEDTESQRWFERVLAEAPQSPRAESALFMDARCQLSRSRTYSSKPEEIEKVAENRPRARELFGQYLAKYPHGILAADALGWLGAIAYDSRDYPAALRYYIAQTELPSHPEIRSSALLMCEKTLSRIASQPNEAALAEVALHPRAAMGLIYLIVNSSEADNFNGEEDDPAEVRKWREAILPQLAHVVAIDKRFYRDPVWQPRFLAILAYAASGAGRQEEALKLSESAVAQPTRSDDLLFARAVALQRAGKLGEAITAYQAFEKNFPRSPLARGAQLRLALTLQDNHQAGEAILALEELNAPEEPSNYSELPPPDLSGAEPAQVKQLIDTLQNFAPLAELAAVVRRSDLAPERRIEFNETLAQRYLAREDFAEAKKYLTPAQWALAAEKIEALTASLGAATEPTERGKLCAELGDRWAAARGKLLTYPLDAEKTRREVYRDDAASADLRRRENAKALGLDAEADAEMENRDELRHAFEWWRKAATPAALWHALEAIPAIADVSPYARKRAAETNAGAVSRQIYEQLRRDFPDSTEARDLAVYWNFSGEPAPPHTRWSSGSQGDSASEDEGRWAPIIPRVLALEKEAAEWELPKLQVEVAELAQQAHALQRTINAAFWINYLDDLQTFLQEPDPGAAIRARYVALRTACMRESVWGYWPETNFNDEDQADAAGNRIDRDAVLRSQIALALADPAMAPVIDYLAFLDLAVVANHLIAVPFPAMPEKDGAPYSFKTRDYPMLEKLTAKFLAEFPKSRKREAAMLLHARAIFMESKPEVAWQEIFWPESGRWDYAEAERTKEQMPFDPVRISVALDAYDHEYPRGQYAAEIRDFRGAVAARQRDWKPALELTLTQLHDSAHPSLQPAAQERLDRLFVRLLESKDRAELFRAIKASPPARAALADFLQREETENPLAELKDYLSAQLADGAGKA